ncbi:MAG: hypothetical protein QOE44_2762 [Solirubrobacteraceae bacterium]|jgi:uncharacterized membrane protein|nr:hypothetical protein [Solirubrobacteraceae bacterium]
MDWHNHMSSGAWVLSILGMTIMLALVAVTVVWIAREVGDRRRPLAAASGREILDRRLASGEIEADEYEQLRETLGGPVNPAAGPAPVRPPSPPPSPRGGDA